MISLLKILREEIEREEENVTYKREVLNLSRDFIKQFNTKLGKRFKYETTGQVQGVDDMGEEIPFELTIRVVPNKKLEGYPYSIEAWAMTDEVEMDIEYNPLVFPAAFNDFIAEVKEGLRHEMEHIAQRQKRSKGVTWVDRGDRPFYEYLLLPQEIPAYIRGLNTRAKTKRITLGQAFEEYFNDYRDSFGSESEIEIVRKEWLRWAKKNLPKTKI